jgi:hypothetical protein
MSPEFTISDAMNARITLHFHDFFDSYILHGLSECEFSVRQAKNERTYTQLIRTAPLGFKVGAFREKLLRTLQRPDMLCSKRRIYVKGRHTVLGKELSSVTTLAGILYS